MISHSLPSCFCGFSKVFLLSNLVIDIVPLLFSLSMMGPPSAQADFSNPRFAQPVVSKTKGFPGTLSMNGAALAGEMNADARQVIRQGNDHCGKKDR